MAGQEPVTRERVEGLRAALTVDKPTATKNAVTQSAAPAKDARVPSRRMLTLEAELDGETVSLIVDAAPSEPGCVFIRKRDDARPRTVSASRLKLIGFASGATT